MVVKGLHDAASKEGATSEDAVDAGNDRDRARLSPGAHQIHPHRSQISKPSPATCRPSSPKPRDQARKAARRRQPPPTAETTAALLAPQRRRRDRTGQIQPDPGHAQQLAKPRGHAGQHHPALTHAPPRHPRGPEQARLCRTAAPGRRPASPPDPSAQGPDPPPRSRRTTSAREGHVDTAASWGRRPSVPPLASKPQPTPPAAGQTRGTTRSAATAPDPARPARSAPTPAAASSHAHTPASRRKKQAPPPPFPHGLCPAKATGGGVEEGTRGGAGR
jgi:hypothetical protein